MSSASQRLVDVRLSYQRGSKRRSGDHIAFFPFPDVSHTTTTAVACDDSLSQKDSLETRQKLIDILIDAVRRDKSKSMSNRID